MQNNNNKKTIKIISIDDNDFLLESKAEPNIDRDQINNELVYLSKSTKKHRKFKDKSPDDIEFSNSQDISYAKVYNKDNKSS